MDALDAYNIRVISDPFVSGDEVYFTINWIDGNTYRSSIYVLNDKGVNALPRALNQRMPVRFGKSLYFVSSPEYGREILIQEGESGNSIIDLNASKIIKYRVVSDGIVAIIERNNGKQYVSASGLNRYKLNSKGYLFSGNSLVFSQNGEIRIISSGDYEVVDFSIYGRKVAFISTQNHFDDGFGEIYLYDLESPEKGPVNVGAEPAIMEQICLTNRDIFYTCASPNNKLSDPRTLHSIREGALTSMAFATDLITSDLFSGGTSRIIYDNDRIYLIGHFRDVNRLVSVSAENPVIEDTKILQDSVRDFSAFNGRIAFVTSTFEKPSVLKFGNFIYDPNPNISGKYPKKVVINDADFWIMFNGKEKQTVLSIHGGPHMAYGDSYNIEFNYLYSKGFNVIFGNPVGSTGYGPEFSGAIVGDWGGKDFDQIMAAVETFKKIFDLADSFHITGGSYGGFLTNHAITRTNKFASAISERGVSNFISKIGTSDLGYLLNVFELGLTDPWDESSLLLELKLSPIFHSKAVKTPTLFIHGDQDLRAPLGQSEEMYHALIHNGIESKILIFVGENHELPRHGKPQNMITRLEEKYRWIVDHTKKVVT